MHGTAWSDIWGVNTMRDESRVPTMAESEGEKREEGMLGYRVLAPIKGLMIRMRNEVEDMKPLFARAPSENLEINCFELSFVLCL